MPDIPKYLTILRPLCLAVRSYYSPKGRSQGHAIHTIQSWARKVRLLTKFSSDIVPSFGCQLLPQKGHAHQLTQLSTFFIAPYGRDFPEVCDLSAICCGFTQWWVLTSKLMAVLRRFVSYIQTRKATQSGAFEPVSSNPLAVLTCTSNFPKLEISKFV